MGGYLNLGFGFRIKLRVRKELSSLQYSLLIRTKENYISCHQSSCSSTCFNENLEDPVDHLFDILTPDYEST